MSIGVVVVKCWSACTVTDFLCSSLLLFLPEKLLEVLFVCRLQIIKQGQLSCFLAKYFCLSILKFPNVEWIVRISARLLVKASENELTCLLFQLCWTAGKGCENAGLRYASEIQISFLPLSHIAGSIMDIYGAMMCAATVYFAQPDALRVC